MTLDGRMQKSARSSIYDFIVIHNFDFANANLFCRFSKANEMKIGTYLIDCIAYVDAVFFSASILFSEN